MTKRFKKLPYIKHLTNYHIKYLKTQAKFKQTKKKITKNIKKKSKKQKQFITKKKSTQLVRFNNKLTR